MKKLFYLIVILVLILSINPIFGAAQNIRLATIMASGSAIHEAILLFKDELEANTGFKVQIFADGTLGGERDNLESLSAGTLEMSVCGVADAVFYAPETYVVELPYLFESREHNRNFWNGPGGEYENNYILERTGIRTLAVLDRGPRYLTANRKVLEPSDLKGMAMRLPENAVWQRVWQHLGASPQGIAYPEIFGALQLGVVEGQENPLQDIYNNRWFEVQDYLMATKHVISVFKWHVSDKFWKTLNADQQNAIQQAIDKAVEFGNILTAQSEDRILVNLQREGMILVQPDVAQFQAKVAEIRDELVKEFFVREVYDLIEAARP